MFNGISFKAVLFGMLADIGLTQWWGIQFVFWTAILQAAYSQSAGHFDHVAYEHMLQSFPANLTGFFYGSIGSLIGGALTARLATRAPQKNVFVLCGLELVFSVGYLAIWPIHTPGWVMVGGVLLSVVMPWVGARLSTSLFGTGTGPQDAATS